MTGIFVSEVAVKVDARFRRHKVKLSLSILLVGFTFERSVPPWMRITAKKHFYIRFERTAYCCPNYALPPSPRHRLSIQNTIDTLDSQWIAEIGEKRNWEITGMGSIFATKGTTDESAYSNLCDETFCNFAKIKKKRKKNGYIYIRIQTFDWNSWIGIRVLNPLKKSSNECTFEKRLLEFRRGERLCNVNALCNVEVTGTMLFPILKQWPRKELAC